MEVNVDLFEKVEALGDIRERELPPLEWTEGALALLQLKIKESPPIAMDFVGDMIRHDTEEMAREKGLTRIDEQAAVELWGAPQERVTWSDESRVPQPPAPRECGSWPATVGHVQARRLEDDDEIRAGGDSRVVDQLQRQRPAARRAAGAAR